MTTGDHPALVAEAVGMVFALGMALYTSVLFMLYQGSILTSATTLGAFLLAVVVLLPCQSALRRYRRRDDLTSDNDQFSSVLIVVASVVIAVQIIITVRMTLLLPLDFWDSWTTWGFKARMFATGGPPLRYFYDGLTAYTHPDYPLNLPLAESAFYRFPDPFSRPLAAMIGPACLLALLLLLYAGLTRLYNRVQAALGITAFALLPQVIEQASRGYADVPLALYVGPSALYLFLWWKERRTTDLLLMGLFAGGAVWTKKEGLPLAAILVATHLAHEAFYRAAPLSARVRGILGAVLAMLIICAPWLFFVRRVHPIGSDYRPVSLAVFVTHVNRVPHIVVLITREMLKPTHWGFFWPTVALLVVLTALLGRLTIRLRAMFCLLICQIGLVCIVPFIFSSWPDYTVHVRYSIARLLMQATPLALLVAMESIHAIAVGQARVQHVVRVAS